MQENRFKEIVKFTDTMRRSANNVVLFTDVPWLWLQYYLGLVFNRPTIIILPKQFVSYEDFFKKEPLVKKIIHIEQYDKSTASKVSEEIAAFIKANKTYDK